MFRLLGLLLVLAFAVACGSPTATDTGGETSAGEPSATVRPTSPSTGPSTGPDGPSPTLTPAPSQPTPEPPTPPASPPPSVEPPTPPSVEPPTPPPSKPGTSGLIRVKGTIGEGVEAGCTILRAPGVSYQLVGTTNMRLPHDREVTVLGRLRPDMMSYCQQGAILEVKQIWVTDRPPG